MTIATNFNQAIIQNNSLLQLPNTAGAAAPSPTTATVRYSAIPEKGTPGQGNINKIIFGATTTSVPKLFIGGMTADASNLYANGTGPPAAPENGGVLPASNSEIVIDAGLAAGRTEIRSSAVGIFANEVAIDNGAGGAVLQVGGDLTVDGAIGAASIEVASLQVTSYSSVKPVGVGNDGEIRFVLNNGGAGVDGIYLYTENPFAITGWTQVAKTT